MENGDHKVLTFDVKVEVDEESFTVAKAKIAELKGEQLTVEEILTEQLGILLRISRSTNGVEEQVMLSQAMAALYNALK
jgi:hypothetical protein